MNKQTTKHAIALQYSVDEQAPKIVASGSGLLADKILENAKESNVPIHKDTKLAKTLSKLEVGEMIPSELYEVVAEILVFVDGLERMKEKLDVSVGER